MQEALVIEGNSAEIKSIQIPAINENEVLIKHTYVGLNYIDYQQFHGVVSSYKSHLIPGVEGVGIIQKTGACVKSYFKGQRVGYSTATDGAFCKYRNINQDLIYPVPEKIECPTLASYTRKGMTAHYLLRRTFFARKGMTALVHGASSSTGQLLLRLAKHFNVTTIACVSSQSKRSVLDSIEIDHVITYDDFVQKVNEITKGRGSDVCYDPLGDDVLSQSANCTADFGLLVNYGNVLGELKIDVEKLSRKSLFVTSTNIESYKKNKGELVLSAMEVFSLIDKGIFPNKVERVYNFSEIKEALNSNTRPRFASVSMC